MPKDNSGVLTSVVRVHNVTESDYGTYICEGRNELAECKAEVRLLGKGDHIKIEGGRGMYSNISNILENAN